MKKESIVLIVFWLFLILGQVTFVHATFMEQILINTKAISLANSVTADPPGHMSIHYNPAGLTLMDEGIQISQGFALARIERTYKFFPGEANEFFNPATDPLAYGKGSVDNGRIYIPFVGPIDLKVLTAPVPFGMSFKPFGSKITFANAIYAPFAGGFEHNNEDASKYQGEAVYLQHMIYASPSFGLQLTPELSIGASIGFGQSAMGAETSVRAPGIIHLTKMLREISKYMPVPLNVDIGIFENAATMEFNARDDFSPSFNVGLLWQPCSGFSFGIVYQSPISVDMKGKYNIRYEPNIYKMVEWLDTQTTLQDSYWKLDHQTKFVEYGDIKIEDFKYPQRVQVGMMIRPIHQLKLMLDLHWANWSSTEEYVMKFDQDIQLIMMTEMLGYEGPGDVLRYPKDFDDTLHLSFGIEYQLFDYLALRFGYEDRQTCAKDHYFDLFSLPDVKFFGTGLGIKIKQGLELDLGFAYLTYNDYEVPNNTSTNLNSLKPKEPIYSPYAGLNYETSFNAYIGTMNVTMSFEVMKDMLERQLMKLDFLFGG